MTLHTTTFQINKFTGVWRGSCTCGWFWAGSQDEVRGKAAVHDIEWEDAPKPGERGFQPGCGCCAGPEDDRCICHIHQDIQHGRRARKCSLHCAPAEPAEIDAAAPTCS